MTRFLYKLIPPRATFDKDMNEHEGAAMAKHIEYWQGLLAQGRVVVYGPVSEENGVWGLAVVEAEDEAQVRSIGEADPAVTAGVSRFEVWPMAISLVRS